MNTRDLKIASNRVSDIERYIYNELAELYEVEELKQLVRMLFEGFMGWNTVQFLLHKQDTVNQSDLLKFHWAVEDLRRRRPIQYIIGHTNFCNCRINVTESTLIPRPETEEIVNWTIGQFSTPPLSILDLCTGSGCIAIALAKQFPKARVMGVDLSEDALNIARGNAHQNDVNAYFLKADALHLENSLLGAEKWDLIISNPPYVCNSEKAEMQANVLDYEPEMALFVADDDPLVFYQAIARYAAKHLNPEGLLMLEINERFGYQVCYLLQKEGFDAKLEKDFREKDRMVWARQKSRL